MTWTQSIRHPWLTQPSLKRKPSSPDNDGGNSSSSSDASTPALSPRRRKRAKYSSQALERRLAHMSLNAPVTPADPLAVPTTPEDGGISSPKALSELSALHVPPAQNHLNVILPNSVEEPSSPPSDSEPVDMDIEPELVTPDIAPAGNPSHTADNWDGTQSGQLDVEVQISSVVLERLSEQTRRPLIPLPSQTSSQALIIYRPLQLPSPKVLEDVCDDQPDQESELHPRTAPLVAFEEDAMDVE